MTGLVLWKCSDARDDFLYGYALGGRSVLIWREDLEALVARVIEEDHLERVDHPDCPASRRCLSHALHWIESTKSFGWLDDNP